MQRLSPFTKPHYVVVTALILIWVLVLAALPAWLPLHAASWLAFVGLLITPGYLLGDLLTWRLKLDHLERLALAFPLGMAVLAIPGIFALLLHLDIHQLAYGWSIASGLIILLWLVHEARVQPERPQDEEWQVDELIMLGLLLAAFFIIFPTLSLYKIDGDAYAVNSFAADALAGLPLNEKEPLFGTELGPGVRMVFNQSLTLNYLWSYFSVIDANSLVAAASKAVLALWAIFASYTLGKAAGNGSRRFGLLTAAIQLLIYMASPFIRGDNVSLFFFERINADKFMVPVTMLPVIFAFSIRFVRDGAWSAWLAAAVATFAVSTIHPLIAAMLALAIGSFAAVHLLMNLRHRRAWFRVGGLAALVIIVMILPVAQLVLSRGEAPLASAYPSTFEGWDVGEKQVPALPFVHVDSLDYYGPLPDIEELQPADVYEDTNPFLMWRFALNMDRRRLIIFEINQYISDPSLVMEPPYFLALLLLPMFLWRLRRDEAAQFVVGVSLAVLFVMFNPLLTPLIGSLVMPWILWRFIWILPYALIFAMAAEMLMGVFIRLVSVLQTRAGIGRPEATAKLMSHYAALVVVVLAALTAAPTISRNISNLNGRVAFAYDYPTPELIFRTLQAELKAYGPAKVLAEQDLSVTIPAFVANAHIVAHRTPTTSEVFPADQQDDALQRLLDQYHFFDSAYLTEASVGVLERYDVGYLVAKSGGPLDMQLRLASRWFRWLADDEGYSLYALSELPPIDETILGNTAMAERDWATAKEHFSAALEADPANLVARVALAEIAQREGLYETALDYLDQALREKELPVLHYRLGQLYVQQGQLDRSVAAFDRAQKLAPQVVPFHIALGDACLTKGLEQCATVQYKSAVNLRDWRDRGSRLVAEADLWRQRGFTERALPLYEEAATEQPSEYNLFVLISVYRELGMFAQATELVRAMRVLYPLSAEVIVVAADLEAAQENYDEAIGLLKQAIVLQELQVQESAATHLALGQVLLEAGRLDEAGEEIAYAVSSNPYAAGGHTLRGDLFQKRRDTASAVRAYQRSFELDPTQIGVYVALSNELRENGGTPADVMVLLQTALRVDAEESTLLLALGDQWQRLGDTQAAIDAYQSALEQLASYGAGSRQARPLASSGSRAFALSRIATTYEDLGETQSAMNYYRSAVAASPESSWPYLLLGDAHRRRYEVDEAVAAYESAIYADEEYVEAYVRLADLYAAAGETERANSLYQRALELTRPEVAGNEESPPLVNWDAPFSEVQAAFASDETLVRTSLAPPSVAESEALLDHLATNVSDSSLHAVAQLYQAKNGDAQAIQLYKQRIEEAELTDLPRSVIARYHKELGDIYLRQLDLSAAVEAYEEAVELDSWWPAARLGLAEALLEEGEQEAALAQLNQAVELAPGSVEAQIALANVLDDLGQHTEAMTIYVNTASKHPGNERATLALARAWQDRNRWDRAEQAFRNTIALNPGSADAHVGLAEIRMDVAAYDEAEALLQQAQAIDYNNVSSYVRLGELEQRRGNTEAALAWYQRAANLPSADQSLNLTLIDSLVSYGDYETALNYTNNALAFRSDDSELLLRLGRLQRIKGDYAEALNSLTAAQVNDPTNARMYRELAEVYLAQGDVTAALSAYSEAINMQPTEATYYVTGSQLWSALGSPELAEELLRQGLHIVPEPASLYNAIATLQLQQGKADDALDTLREGLDTLGNNTQMFLAMGNYYVNRANFEQVMERYGQALQGETDLAEVHVAIGDVYLLLGEEDSAIAQYREAVEIDPVTPSHQIALGTAYEEANELLLAERAYRQALISAPTLVDAYISLGNLYERQRQFEQALETYEQGRRIAPTSGELLIEYAALKLKQGETTEAMTLLEEAVEVSPTASTRIRRAAIYVDQDLVAEAKADLEAALRTEPAAVEALVALGDLYKAQDDREMATVYYEKAAEVAPGVPTGYLRLGTMAREDEDRDMVVYWNDLARQAAPGGLARPDTPVPELPASN